MKHNEDQEDLDLVVNNAVGKFNKFQKIDIEMANILSGLEQIEMFTGNLQTEPCVYSDYETFIPHSIKHESNKEE
jgi:hypothetical protein